MTIERDGKEYELTKEEMYQAYYTIQRQFDLEDIQNMVDLINISEEDAEYIMENDEFANCVAENFREYVDSFDDYEQRLDALYDAFKDAKKYMKGETS